MLLKLLLNRLQKLMRSYNDINIVITTYYITPVKPLEYISIDFVVSEDLEAYKSINEKALEP
jgi:hypothetical protein